MSAITVVDIIVGVDGNKQAAQLVCNSDQVTIEFVLSPDFRKIYNGADFFKCFGNVREDNPDVVFYCKGSKKNVHTSSMSSQMSLGLKAYELTLGEEPSQEDLIYIFDYDEGAFVNSYSAQREFYMRWVESRKVIDGE
ncbi:hypothetical protein SAMN04487857_1412 [Pseudomonas sp. ok272]|uniref:hypothetical protein n=1 Tax=unclassified Pseudomonas TaxID=196821 RepID=UPI0008BC2F61|nr:MULTISPECIES: hypothetical protein [unclassified Pseudomonas]SEN68553.1 hypothetical protein SAMN04487857_1412 [Pseudomonas sp. ok272]SFN47670.1 hypothetical protein SAMN04487858_1412 [Pseudomonas sp. ok602]